MLCPDWGDKYPFVTSSPPTSTYALHSLGLNAKNLNRVVGCAKCYNTYSGSREDFERGNEEDKLLYEKIAELGKEIGNTTKRKRKICWNDMRQLQRAILINGSDDIVFSKFDILQQLGIWRVYDLSDNLISFDTEQAYKQYLHDFAVACGVKNIYFSYNPEFVEGL